MVRCSNITHNIQIDAIKVLQKHYETFIHRSFYAKKRTLEKLKSRNIKVSDFVRKAISEKIKRDYENLKEKPKDEFCPF